MQHIKTVGMLIVMGLSLMHVTYADSSHDPVRSVQRAAELTQAALGAEGAAAQYKASEAKAKVEQEQTQIQTSQAKTIAVQNGIQNAKTAASMELNTVSETVQNTGETLNQMQQPLQP